MINSIIRSFIYEGKKVIYLIFGEDKTEETRKKLRIYDKCENFVCVNINKGNDVSTFKEQFIF